MAGLASAGSVHVAGSTWWRSGSATRVLLAGGILAGVLYASFDLVSGLLYGGYSFRDQAISELTAFGSPVRPLMATNMIGHTLPLLAFAAGLWRVSRRRSVRAIGVLLVAAVVIGLPIHTIWAMSSRWLEPGFNDTMHNTLTSVWGVSVAAAVVSSAVAYKGWFRVYALATIPVMIAFGAAAAVAMEGLELNQTPWAGAYERVTCYSYFLWLAILAVVAMRGSANDEARERG